MNDNFCFTLDPSSRKYPCPQCGKRRLVRYVNKESGDYLPGQYGRCDREADCRYHLNPYKDGYSKTQISSLNYFDNQGSLPPLPPPKLTAIPIDVLKSTFHGYDQNIFLQALLHSIPFPLPSKDIESVIELYGLGTITDGYLKGAISFPYVDAKGNIRAIQVRPIDASLHGKKANFIHSMVEKDCIVKNVPIPSWLSDYKKNEKKIPCLFGEHLLNRYPNNPIALVEAPKTAILGSLYFGIPNMLKDLLWLAVFNLSSLTKDKCQILKGRKVLLFPDLSRDGYAFTLWNRRAAEFNGQLPGSKFMVSDLLEKHATAEQKAKGLDLADFLINQDWRLFRKPENAPKPNYKLEPISNDKQTIDQAPKDTHISEPEPSIMHEESEKLIFPSEPINLSRYSYKYAVDEDE